MTHFQAIQNHRNNMNRIQNSARRALHQTRCYNTGVELRNVLDNMHEYTFSNFVKVCGNQQFSVQIVRMMYEAEIFINGRWFEDVFAAGEYLVCNS